jgi:hypothetical protein
MRKQLTRRENLQIQSWINDKPISTGNWEVFGLDEGQSEILLLAREPNTGNQLKIIITKYHENFEEVNGSGDQVPESK